MQFSRYEYERTQVPVIPVKANQYPLRQRMS